MAQDTDESRFVQVVVRMPAELHEAIKARAVEEDRNMATVVRRACTQYLAEPAS